MSNRLVGPEEKYTRLGILLAHDIFIYVISYIVLDLNYSHFIDKNQNNMSIGTMNAIYLITLLICSYSLARLCVTFIEFNLSDFRGDYYGFKEKFFIFSAIKNRQWARLIILIISTIILIIIQSNTILDYDISPESQGSRSVSYSEKS